MKAKVPESQDLLLVASAHLPADAAHRACQEAANWQEKTSRPLTKMESDFQQREDPVDEELLDDLAPGQADQTGRRPEPASDSIESALARRRLGSGMTDDESDDLGGESDGGPADVRGDGSVVDEHPRR